MLNEKDLARILLERESFVITTHKFCDGDGLGAGCALACALQKAEKKASFITPDRPHEKYNYLNEKGLIRAFQDSDIERELKKTDCILAVDVNDPSLLEPLFSLAEKRECPIFFIDHHPLLEKNPKYNYFINPSAASTGELVYHLLKALNISLDSQIAVGLYTSIVFDTKCFRFIKNSPSVFSISAELVSHIPDVDQIYRSLFKTLTVEKVRFFNHLSNVEYYNDNRFALLHLTEDDLAEYKADVGMACDLLDMIMNISTMEIVVLILEGKNSRFKLSFRSGKQEVLSMARSFGGGGHKLSAGAYVQGLSYSQIKNQIISKFTG